MWKELKVRIFFSNFSGEFKFQEIGKFFAWRAAYVLVTNYTCSQSLDIDIRIIYCLQLFIYHGSLFLFNQTHCFKLIFISNPYSLPKKSQEALKTIRKYNAKRNWKISDISKLLKSSISDFLVVSYQRSCGVRCFHQKRL